MSTPPVFDSHSYSWLLVRLTQCQYRPELIDNILDHVLQNKICVNVCDEEGMTPLMDAAVYDQDILCDFFLRHGADPHHLTNSDKSALYYALHHHSDEPVKQMRIVRSLIKRLKRIETSDWQNALSHGNADLIRTILEHLPDEEKEKMKLDRDDSLNYVITLCKSTMVTELLRELYKNECVSIKSLPVPTGWTAVHFPHLFQKCVDIIIAHNTDWRNRRRDLIHMLSDICIPYTPYDVVCVIVDFLMGTQKQ